MRFTRITVDPQQMGGVPCLRSPVATVVAMIADGMVEAEILAAYPDCSGKTSPKHSSEPRKLALCTAELPILYVGRGAEACQAGASLRSAVPVSAAAAKAGGRGVACESSEEG